MVILSTCSSETLKIFGAGSFYFIVGDSQEVADFLTANQDKITDFYLENDRRNSAIPSVGLNNSRCSDRTRGFHS